MTWFGWLLLSFSTFWVTGLVCIIFVSILPYCWGCLERRFCPKRLINNKNKSIRKYLVTKKVLPHGSIQHTVGNILIDDKLESSEAKGLITTEDYDLEDQEELLTQPCPICLEPFKAGDSVSWSKHLLFCKHVYHTDCIFAWLQGDNDICPCCRRDYYTMEETQDYNAEQSAEQDARIVKVLTAGKFCELHGLCLPPHSNLIKDCAKLSIPTAPTDPTDESENVDDSR